MSVRKIQRRKARIRANSALTCCKSTASFLSIAVEKSKLCLVRIRNIVKINKRVKKMIKQKAPLKPSQKSKKNYTVIKKTLLVV